MVADPWKDSNLQSQCSGLEQHQQPPVVTVDDVEFHPLGGEAW